MKESEIERFFIKKSKKKGWLPVKFLSPSMAGLPDRIVLLPGGQVVFVELKATGRKPRPIQLAVHRVLNQMGFTVFVIDSKEDVVAYVDVIEKKVGGTT